jgi:hypothetical protein
MWGTTLARGYLVRVVPNTNPPVTARYGNLIEPIRFYGTNGSAGHITCRPTLSMCVPNLYPGVVIPAVCMPAIKLPGFGGVPELCEEGWWCAEIMTEAFEYNVP